eukprot:UN17863
MLFETVVPKSYVLAVENYLSKKTDKDYSKIYDCWPVSTNKEYVKVLISEFYKLIKQNKKVFWDPIEDNLRIYDETALILELGTPNTKLT